MADQDKKPAAAGTAAGPDTPAATIVNQYVKDLSFENPNAFEVFQQFSGATPKIDVAIDIKGEKKTEDAHEVELKFTVTTQSDERGAFVIELVYAGLFQVRNMKEEHLDAFIHVQAPFILFPFARRVIADVTRDGGYPPLMLDPIDFTSLYQQRLAAMASKEKADA